MLGVSDKQPRFVEILKDPSFRQCGMMGWKSQDQVQMITFVSEKILLLKMATWMEQVSYWTMMNSMGLILKMPRALERLVNGTNWSKIESFSTIVGLTEVLLTSDSKFATVTFNEDSQIV